VSAAPIRQRLSLLVKLSWPVLVLGAALRVVLHLAFATESSGPLALGLTLAVGVVYDALTAVVVLTPVALALFFFRSRWIERPLVRGVVLGVAYTLVVFEAFVEYFFFEEFNARFNNIAVDYVLYPHEVVGNVFESYNVPLFVALAVASGATLGWFLTQRLGRVELERLPWAVRLRGAATSFGIALASVAGLYALPREVSEDRITSEIAAGGPVQLVRAFWSAGLDFPLYYRTLPTVQARERAADLLGFDKLDGALATAAPDALVVEKHVGRAGVQPKQIVIVLEESFGSDFVGALGHARTPCTPSFERWMENGLTLTNLTSNGNRTVRGLEGVLCSFVPLPGDSIVKRDRSENVATAARVAKANGYSTAYFYGGYGMFDGMKPFMPNNGYDEFIDEPDFPDDAFRTIWGVADEYIFDALVARQLAAREKGEKLFATLLSVSNHKPYRVPSGRVDWPDDDPHRQGAVMYADWCIGRYLDTLASNGLLADTLVLIVGDHGARVYGAEQIPTSSYRIPALFVSPDPQWKGRRIDRLCGQIDLLPTLFELAGIECRAPFFGESVLSAPSDGGRAFVHHNREVGILTDNALVVLGLQNAVAYYTRAGRGSDEFTRVEPDRATPELRSLADDASAVFGTAYELYQNRRLRLPGDLSEPSVSHARASR